MYLGFDARENARNKRAGYVTKALVAPYRKYPLKLTVSAVVAACKFCAKATAIVTATDMVITTDIVTTTDTVTAKRILKYLTGATAIVTASDTVIRLMSFSFILDST